MFSSVFITAPRLKQLTRTLTIPELSGPAVGTLVPPRYQRDTDWPAQG